jgi:predicted small lipoprotein YifL
MRIHLALAVVVVIGVTACGQKGPLYRGEPDSTETRETE